MSKSKIFKRILKIIGVILLLLFILLVGFYFALQSPKFQTFIAKKVTNALSNSLGTDIEIESVEIEFFNNVKLENLLVKDLSNDTLFFLEKVNTELNYFSMFDKNIDLDEISIEGLYVNIYRAQMDTSFNFSFLANGNKKATPDTLKQDLDWQLSLNDFKLTNTRFNFKDSLTGMIIQSEIPKLETMLNEIDIQEKDFKIENVLLKNPEIVITKLKNYKENNPAFVLDIPAFIHAENVVIENGNVNFKNKLDTNSYKYMTYNDLNLENLNLELNDVFLRQDSLTVNINEFTVIENGGFTIKEFQSDLTLTNKKIKLEGLALKTNNSQINSDAELSFRSFEGFNDFFDGVRIKASLKNTVINPADVKYFADIDKLGINGVFKIDGNISGRASSIRAKDVVLKAGNRSEFRGDFSLNGLPNIKETFISLRTEKLVTDYDDFKFIYDKIPLPPNAKTLGTILFKGRFDGFYSDFVANGEVYTDLGLVETDINLKLNNNGIPSYSGQINTTEFKIGKWFGLEEKIGAVSLKASIVGNGLKLNTIDAKLKGDVSEVYLNGYNYTNIEVDGSLKDNFFKGNAVVDDENLKMNFNGLVDATKDLPVYDFTATLDKINLLPLNLAKKDFILSGKLKSNFTANNIDNILGTLDVTDFRVELNDKSYNLKSLSLKSSDLGYEKLLELYADNISLTAAGNFELSKVPTAFKNIFVSDDTLKVGNQNIRLDIEITDETELISLFVPDLQIPKKIIISANLDSESESLLAVVNIPKLKYGKVKANKFISNISVRNGQIDMINSLPEILLNDSLLVRDISLIANGTKDDLDFNVNATNKNENTALGLLGNVAYKNDLYQLSLDTNSTILINNDFWNIASGNLVSFNKNVLEASNFKVYNSTSEANFKINGENGTNNLVVNLKDIEVEDFNDILKDKGIDLQGVLNGEVKIDNFDKEPVINGDLSFLNIFVNDYNVGDFKIDSRLDLPDKKVYLSGGLFSKENHIDINGSYSFNKISTPNDFEIDIFIKQFTIKSLEDFIPEFISNSSGTVNGSLKLTGARKEPNLNGFVEVNDVTTTVSFTQVPYTIAGTKVVFSNNLLQLADKIEVRDEEGNVAYGTGKITHNNFKDWGIDIKINTEKLKALNTTIKDNEDFYGTAYIKGGATFTGKTDEPLIYIFGESLENSFLDVPLIDGVTNKEYEFYSFVNKKPVVVDPDYEEEIVENVIKIMGAKVKLDLDIDQDLELKIILDQDAGDVLKVKGNGNIKIDVGKGAEYVDFFGNYNVAEGDYLFTMQNLVNKAFKIEPGSTINFNGDIYEDATVDMAATYSRKVTLEDFIVEYLGQDEELTSLAKNRVPVTLFLDLSDKLSKPTIKFDIAIDRVDPKLRGFVESKLQAIQLNESELNNQIFGVLVLSRFLPSYTALENTFGANSSDAVLNTVTELISSQFSRYFTDWASLLVKDLEVYVNFSSYDPSFLSEETTNLRRELQLALSKRFFNDRLTINVGGNFDFGESYDDPSSNNTSNSTFFGANVSFEYSLTKNRRWRMKAFTTSDYDNYNENNRSTRSGVGLSYKREFDDLNDLFNIKKKKKKKEEEEEKEKKDEDSKDE